MVVWDGAGSDTTFIQHEMQYITHFAKNSRNIDYRLNDKCNVLNLAKVCDSHSNLWWQKSDSLELVLPPQKEFLDRKVKFHLLGRLISAVYK